MVNFSSFEKILLLKFMSAYQNDFLIGAYRVQPSRNIITFSGKEIKVTPLLMSMLTILVDNQGKTVAKSHLLSQVWGNISVSEAALFRNISELRRIFGDDAKSQHIIETIPKKGYRLKADVIFVDNTINKPKTLQQRSINQKNLIFMLFIVIATIAYSLWQPEQQPQFLSPKIDYLTSDQSFQRGPRYSPSGRYLLYYEISNGLYSTKIKDLNSNSSSILIENSINILTAIFSPGEEEVIYVVNNQETCEIRQISLITKAEKKFLDCPTGDMPYIFLDWSPDGTKLLYSIKAKKTGMRLFTIRDLKQQKNIELKLPQNSTMYYPRFSPDSKKIAYITTPYISDLTHEINIYDIESQKNEVVYRSIDFIFQTVWSDNNHVLYFLQGAGKSNAKGLWKLNIENQQQQHILNGNYIDMDFNIDKNQFVLVQRTQNRNIWFFNHIDKSTENNHHQLTQSNLMDREPALNPTGQYLAFISNQSGNNELWLKSLETGVLEQITHYDNSSISLPNWLPSGNEISFSLTQDGIRKFLIYNIENKRFSNLKLPEKVDTLDWKSPHQLYWTSSNNLQNQVNLYHTDLLTDETTLITQLPNSFFRYHAEYGIIYSPYSDSKNLFAYSLESHQSTQLKNIQLSSPTSWDLYNNKLYYISRFHQKGTATPGFSIRIFDLNNHKDELYTKVKIPRIQDFGRTILSVNQTGIYYTRQDNVTLDLISVGYD